MKRKKPELIQDRRSQKARRSSPGYGKRRRYGRRYRRRICWKHVIPALILLCIFLYGAVRLIAYAAQSARTRRTNAELVEMYEGANAATPNPTPSPSAAVSTPVPVETQELGLLSAYQYIGDALLPEAEELYSKNHDLVAWIHIPGVVNLPVVYRDNTYYMDRDFYGYPNNSGTLFLDKAHPLREDTQYLVVHGHAMHDGSMFGYLTHYRRQAYALEHPTVYFNTLYRREEYEVVCTLRVPTDVNEDGYVPYIGPRKFQDEEHFYAFTDEFFENALYWKSEAELMPSDALLALSTCFEDDRIVVVCRRTGVEERT